MKSRTRHKSIRIGAAAFLPLLWACGNCVGISPELERASEPQVRLTPEERPPSSRFDKADCVGIEWPDASRLRGWRDAELYEELEARLQAFEEAQLSDSRCESHTWEAYTIAGSGGSDTLEKLDRWVAARPNSAIPRVVRSIALVVAGYDARGSQLSRDTPRESFDRMRAFFDRGIEDILAANELAPPQMSAACAAARIGRATGRAAYAEKLVDVYLERNPPNYLARRRLIEAYRPKWGGSLKDVERVAKEAQKFADRNPRLRVLLGFHHAYAAEQAYQNGNYRNAITDYSKALEYGDYGTVWARGRANSYRRLKKYDLTLEDIEYAKLAVPNDADTWLVGGLIHIGRADWPAALTHLDRAIEIRPTCCRAHNYRGYVNEHLGRWEAAVEDYRVGFEGDCTKAWTAYNLGQLLLERFDRPEEAVLPLRRAVELESDNQESWFKLGRAQQLSGDQAAADSYRQSLTLVKPGDPQSEAYAVHANRYLNPSLGTEAEPLH
jgi:tetratricopeptide (TPR) repeat protein